MLMNFSPVNTSIPEPYMSQDEVEILLEIDKLKWEEMLFESIEEDMLCSHM